jgi:hypothetical protein
VRSLSTINWDLFVSTTATRRMVFNDRLRLGRRNIHSSLPVTLCQGLRVVRLPPHSLLALLPCLLHLLKFSFKLVRTYHILHLQRQDTTTSQWSEDHRQYLFPRKRTSFRRYSSPHAHSQQSWLVFRLAPKRYQVNLHRPRTTATFTGRKENESKPKTQEMRTRRLPAQSV